MEHLTERQRGLFGLGPFFKMGDVQAVLGALSVVKNYPVFKRGETQDWSRGWVQKAAEHKEFC